MSPPQSKFKHRKVYAIRHFPPGCGPNAVSLRPKPVEQTSSLLPLENVEATPHDLEVVSNVKDEIVSETVKLEVIVLENKVESSLDKVKCEVLEVMEEAVEPLKLQGRDIHSKMYRSPRRRKVSAVRQFPPGCGPNSGGIKKVSNRPVFAGGISSEPLGLQICSPKQEGTKNILVADVDVRREKQSIRIDDCARVPGAESSLNSEKLVMNEAMATDGSEKVGVTDRRNSEVIRGKEIMIDKSVLVRSDSDKNFRVQGASEHAQIKSSLKSGSNGKSLMKSGSNKFIGCSSSDGIFEGCTVDQAVRNFQTKAHASNSSHLVVKSQFGTESIDKKGMPFMEKVIGKEIEINQNSSKKRKLSARDYTGIKSDDSLAVTDERMIVLALMASENCPWKNSKVRRLSSDSIVPKSKITKEMRLVNKNPTSKNFFSYKQKSEGLTVDDDNILDEDNELRITMIPFAPPESSQKGGDNEEVVARQKVKRVLRLFQLICRKLLQGEESGLKGPGKIHRIDLRVASILKDNGEYVNSGEPIIGLVPGVEIGDEFHFRVELSIVGLHRPFQGGIDFTNKNGKLVATSIVASDGCQDDMDSSDVLIYSGSGGTSVAGGDKQQVDQKLARGNLSLKNSIGTKIPVRVIHGFKEKGNDPHDTKGKLVSTFTYDGLYQVETFWQELGNHGFNVFKFQLRRMAGQPELAFKELRRSAKLKIREGLCVKDISQGKEKMPIAVINKFDNDQPAPFKYITKSIYPLWYAKTPSRGCDCTGGCSDSVKCACAVKNGGEIPFNFNGSVVQAKSLIYECGPSCKCSQSCHNRVSQRGIRMPLEIFKTRDRGWGVRSLKSIASGSFICEYVGELLQDGEAEQRTTNDEYLFDIGHNYDDRSLWEDLPNLIPGLQSNSECDTVESVGFTIDAAEYGNVGRFINHSCSPNLYAQNVLYDHDDKRMPHIVFFASDNIPPLQELTYHYNYTIDQVRDFEGNIKQKPCHCGSPECCGRLY